MSMVDYRSNRPFGAPDQRASRMFRSKPDQNPALQGALNAGGTQTQTGSSPAPQVQPTQPQVTQAPSMFTPRNGNTGISGFAGGMFDAASRVAPSGLAKPPVPELNGSTVDMSPLGIDTKRPGTTAAPSTPDYSTFANTMGQYAIGNGQGYDPAKLADPTRGDSAKYRIGRVLSHFNLADKSLGGLRQPGVQEALNAAGLSDGGVRIVDEDEIQLLGKADPTMGRTTRLDLISDYDKGQGKAGFLQLDKGGVYGGVPAGPMMTQNPLTTDSIAALGMQDGQAVPDASGARTMLEQILAQLQNPQQLALKKALGSY